MAVIYSYPEKTTPAGGDFLVITDSEQPAPNKNRTKSLTVDNLADYVVTSTSGITGSGTLNTIAMFTPNGQAVGDSQLLQEVSSNGLHKITFNNANTFVINKPSSVTSFDPDFMIRQDNVPKVSMGWDDDGAGFGFLYNWAGDGWRFGSQGNNPELTIVTTAGNEGVTIANNLSVNGTLDVEGISTFNNQALFYDPATFLDNVVVDGEYLEIQCAIKDSSANLPSSAGQILVGDEGGSVTWTDSTDIVSGAIAKLIPFQVTASAGGSSAYNADNNIVEIGWTGGNGTYTLFLPTATDDNQYRNIRFVTNSTFPGGASDKVQITALPGETIDGAQFFEISKVYEGVSVWSNGTEWIIIQAKAH